MNLVKFLRRKLYNTLFFQKRYWIKRALRENSLKLSLGWGDPESSEDPLGNYKKVKDDLLIPYISDKNILEIGCLDGKWSKYLFQGKTRVTLVDFDKAIKPLLVHRLGRDNFVFYETKGYELAGIETNSVDFVFSMDTLVRVPIWAIRRYMQEFRRVLSLNGKMLLHLPCVEPKGSKAKGFVPLRKSTIEDMCLLNGFKNYQIVFDIIKHGVLLKVNYE